jgi:hypothetical protein
MNSPYLIDILFMDNKPKRGGKRKGAGAPKKEPTKVITFRVKLWQEEAVRAAVKAINLQRQLPSS